MKNRTILETEYLIIGNSAGAIGAAEAIREVDRVGCTFMVSDELYLAYSRPLISEYLTGERTIEEMLFRPADFYEQNNIRLLLDKKVRSLGLERKEVELAGGERIKWQKLLLATGGKPIVPDIRGLDKKGVFTFLTLDNAKTIVSFIDKVRHAVVIGGGLIGISVAEALMKLGVIVTVVEMKDRILNTILDDEASLMAEQNLKHKGFGVITNHTASEFIGGPSVEGVIMDNGERVLCEMVVIAIGVLPRTELALNTEIEVNRGIVVDRHMATSYANVYACGDVAEAYDFVYGMNRVIPIWPNAYIGGRVAGHNMAGIKAEYLGGTAMNSLNYFGMDIATAGIVAPQDSSSYEVIRRRSDDVYQKVVLSDDVVVGMVFVRDIEKSGMVFGLMRERVNVSNFKEKLLADDFGLVYFPPELRRQRLGTGSSGTVIPSSERRGK
jgi:NAD(P)H-nitrite reductase large subunit